MKKHLYFYLYVGDGFLESPITSIHKKLLTRYLHIFDEAHFFIAVDSLSNLTNFTIGNDWVNEIMASTKKKITYDCHILKNSSARESQMVIQEILPKILNRERSMCFIAHNKGTTNSLNTSIIKWVGGLYYYSCEFMDELDELMSKEESVMYGPFKTKFSYRRDSIIQTHNTIYCGGFYWINPSKYLENSINKDFAFTNLLNPRYFSENLPMSLNESCLTSHNNIIFNGVEHNLYEDSNDRWEKTLDKCGEKCDFLNIINEFNNDLWEKL